MSEQHCWILRHQGRVLTMPGNTGREAFPCATIAQLGISGEALSVGEWQGRACFAAEIETLPRYPIGEPTALRSVFAQAGAEAFALAGRAVQLLDWLANHRYCGRCGKPTTRHPDDLAMLCGDCGLVAYPRISPAVMVLVRRGNELLLARSPRFAPGVYSALAGFVEAGETLEQCAAREVREEVGIEIANLRYFGSQSWPFPNSLMAAFIADHAGGVLRPDAKEIEAAAWFSCHALPLLPEPVSIARHLIDAACESILRP